jgi:hypothetical protein
MIFVMKALTPPVHYILSVKVYLNYSCACNKLQTGNIKIVLRMNKRSVSYKQQKIRVLEAASKVQGNGSLYHSCNKNPKQMLALFSFILFYLAKRRHSRI